MKRRFAVLETQINNIFAVAMASTLLVGCASPKTTIVPSMQSINAPPMGEEHEVELGDTIVSKGKMYTYDGIDLKNQVEAGDGVFLLKFTVAPQTLLAKLEDKDWTYYVGDNVRSFDAMIGTRSVFGGIKISKRYGDQVVTNSPNTRNINSEPHASSAMMANKPHHLKSAIFGNSTAVTFAPKPEPDFEHVKVNAIDKPGFVQELIYNGRAGDSAKFLYRELANSVLRAPFSQEVQYDLKESKVIGFKGARIEVIDASNTRLKYKVISNFPDPQ
jgi:hypothetical protein